jgi:hypothetical protein
MSKPQLRIGRKYANPLKNSSTGMSRIERHRMYEDLWLLMMAQVRPASSH